MKHVAIAVVCSFLLGLGAGYLIGTDYSFYNRCLKAFNNDELAPRRCIIIEAGPYGNINSLNFESKSQMHTRYY